MRCCPSSHWRCERLRSWFRDYDKLQRFAVFLIYIQIGCSLIGSLGALYNGVLVINLVVSLFALIAIESSSQSLGRTYAVLLGCTVLLDLAWFILFSDAIWNISSQKYGPLFIFSVRLTLCMQIIGSSMRLLSAILWIQMYRLGASSVEKDYRDSDFDLRNSFLNPPIHDIDRDRSVPDDFLGGSIYDPIYFSSLFEDAEESGGAHVADKQSTGDDGGSASTSEALQLKSCISRSFQANVGAGEDAGMASSSHQSF